MTIKVYSDDEERRLLEAFRTIANPASRQSIIDTTEHVALIEADMAKAAASLNNSLKKGEASS